MIDDAGVRDMGDDLLFKALDWTDGDFEQAKGVISAALAQLLSFAEPDRSNVTHLPLRALPADG